jgi:FecR protein
MVNAMKRLLVPITVFLLGLPAWAQQPAQFPQEDPADAAQHGVARVSLAEGNVSMTRGDSGESTSSALNAPLVTADRVFTGEGSRAEVQFDASNLIRLAPNTEVRMGELEYRSYLIQIAQGTVMLRVGRDTDARIELSTPNATVSPLRQGVYRVTVHPDGTSEITARSGEANILAASGSERLPSGQTMLARGSFNDPEFMTVGAAAFDDWDRWNSDRDRTFDRYSDRQSETLRNTGPDMSGTEDLAANGRWVNDPQYGNVWVPNQVSPDWAPYRDGRWDYVDYYGWSWVSYDPWGWAPYHYGNWYRGAYGWAWYPGQVRTRQYWRPALVGFFGFGGGGFGTAGFGLSAVFGYSNVGWVPLAPHEVYRPWYGRGYVGGRNGGIVGNVNIAGSYRNARYADAVTGLRTGDFGRVAAGRNSFVRPGSGDLARAGMVNGAVPFTPPARSTFPARSTRGNAVVPLDGNSGQNYSGQNSRQNGGWRRMDSPQSPQTPRTERSEPAAGNPGGFRSFDRAQGGARGGQGQNYQEQRPSEPVRLSPPIVNNRGNETTNGAPPNAGNPGSQRNGFGGFGGPRFNSNSPGGGTGQSQIHPPQEMQRSAPAQQMQRQAPPPQMQRSAPAPAGGGGLHGGGGGAPRGGGGGGGRGNGGGNGHEGHR